MIQDESTIRKYSIIVFCTMCSVQRIVLTNTFEQKTLPSLSCLFDLPFFSYLDVYPDSLLYSETTLRGTMTYVKLKTTTWPKNKDKKQWTRTLTTYQSALNTVCCPIEHRVVDTIMLQLHSSMYSLALIWLELNRSLQAGKNNKKNR